MTPDNSAALLSTHFGPDVLDLKPRGVVILIAAIVALALSTYCRRLNREISRRLGAEGHASQFPDPEELAVWSPGWGSYDRLPDAGLRRRIRLSLALGWLEVLAALIGIAAMFAF